MPKADRNAPVGVFDSGLGGLTVVREILRNLPQERIVYFGDTARVPYGSKSRETILTYSRQIVRFLETQEVKAIVVACNTASAQALDVIEKETDLPMIGVVRPGSDMAAARTKNGRIGVIATESTIRSGLYGRLIREKNPDLQVFGKACPLLVPLVEEGWTDDPVTEQVIARYLGDLLQEDIDTLIMGCTHYPLLQPLLQHVAGSGVQLVNPAYETSLALAAMLHGYGLLHEGRAKAPADSHRFYVSDSADRFRTFAESILPCGAKHTQLVRIDNQ